MINRKIEKALNVGSGYSLNLIDLIRLIKKKFNYKKDFTYEKKNYPGFIANINLLRVSVLKENKNLKYEKIYNL